MAMYRGIICRLAAPFARPAQAESKDAPSVSAIEAVDDRFCIRWVMVRMRGIRAGDRVARSNRGAKVR